MKTIYKTVVLFLLLTASIGFANSASTKWHVEKSNNELTFQGELDKTSVHLKYYCHYPSYTYTPDVNMYLGYETRYVSIATDHNLRIELNRMNRTSDSQLINKLITSDQVNFYNILGDTLARTSLKSLQSTLQKYKNDISQCKTHRKNQYEAYIAKEESDELNEKLIIGGSILGGLIAVILIAILLKKAWRKFRETFNGKRAKQALILHKTKRKQEKINDKITETAIDEAVRQLVRQAVNDGVNPNDIKICSTCSGNGCDSCKSKGWIVIS